MRISHTRSQVVLTGLNSPLRHALSRLAGEGVRWQELLPDDADDDFATALRSQLQRLASRGLLQISVDDGEQLLAQLRPIGEPFSLTLAALPDRFMLSRFAYQRRDGNQVVWETPTTAAQFTICDERILSLFFRLQEPQTSASLRQTSTAWSEACWESLLLLIMQAGLLTSVDEQGQSAEDMNPGLMYWEFHDLLFHASSREGRHDRRLGATFDFADWTPAPPPIKQPPPGLEEVSLTVPDLEARRAKGRSLTRLLDDRISVREYAEEAITRDELGEFLYRTARATDQYSHEFDLIDLKVEVEFASRPYPGAGGLHELEFYPVVQRCQGLDRGFYYYAPDRHCLLRYPTEEHRIDRLLTNAGNATMIEPDDLQVLIVVAARFPRVMWKYSGIAYSLTLKNVGVAYQTMYLAATDMGLGPCGIGAGSSDAFAFATESDYYQESSVGEFLLGRPKAYPPGGDFGD